MEPERFLAGQHIRTAVVTDEDNYRIVRVPPQYASLFKSDRCIESWMHQCPFLPRVLEELDAAQLAQLKEAVAGCMRVLVEIKPDVLCPKRKLEGRLRGNSAKNKAYGGDLVDYVQSSQLDAACSPAAQVATCAVLSRTRPVAVCTGNRMTFDVVDVDVDVDESAEGASATHPHAATRTAVAAMRRTRSKVLLSAAAAS